MDPNVGKKKLRQAVLNEAQACFLRLKQKWSRGICAIHWREAIQSLWLELL
jgi:hypothetical protein